MRVLVCGDRDYTDSSLVWSILQGFYEHEAVGWLTVTASPFVVIEGQCPYGGADKFAEEWCKNSPLHGPPVDLATYNPVTYDDSHGGMPIAHLPFPANWDKYGKKAGPIRNAQMLEEGRPNLVLAFHDNLQFSHGTKDMCEIAVKAKIKTLHIEALWR